MFKFVSRLFTTVLIALIALVLATPVGATSPAIPQSGEGSYSYAECYGEILYTGSGTWTWHLIVNKNATLYQWRHSGQFETYRGCDNGTLINSGSYSDHSLRKDINGQWSFTGHSRGTNGDNKYRYIVVVVNGQPKVNHYWLNGIKVY